MHDKETFELLKTDSVTEPTRKVLLERLAKPSVINPRFFDLDVFKTVHAVCNRIIPQSNADMQVDLPGLLDAFLADDKNKGWRYNSLPPNETLFSHGFKMIAQYTLVQYGTGFADLTADLQDALLQEVQDGKTALAYEAFDSSRFFEELLALLTELYYGHPIAKNEIGDISYADAHGWQQIDPLPLHTDK